MIAVNQLDNLKYHYDYDHDILYVDIGTPTLSYGDELYPGIYVNYSDANDIVTGAIIMDFLQQETSLIQQHLPINIAFDDIKRELGLNQ